MGQKLVEEDAVVITFGIVGVGATTHKSGVQGFWDSPVWYVGVGAELQHLEYERLVLPQDGVVERRQVGRQVLPHPPRVQPDRTSQTRDQFTDGSVHNLAQCITTTHRELQKSHRKLNMRVSPMS